MTSAQQVLDEARHWIGTAEKPLGSNKVAGVTDWFGINGPWCAMWVSRVFSNVGLPLPATIAKGFAYCPSGVAWFKANRRWTNTPQPGHVVFFQWPGSSRAEHVGIVESVNHDGSVNTIEGNTNKAGSPEGLYVMRQLRRSYILGYGIPDFNGPQPQKPPTVTDLKDENVQRIDFHITLDNDGNGYVPLTTKGTQVSAPWVNGTNPAKEGYPKRVPQLVAQRNGDEIIVSAVGGLPNSAIDGSLSVQ